MNMQAAARTDTCRDGRVVPGGESVLKVRAGRKYAGAVAWREELGRGSTIEVVNPHDDTSIAAIDAWIAALEQDDDWIELPVTAAELIEEDRSQRDS